MHWVQLNICVFLALRAASSSLEAALWGIGGARPVRSGGGGGSSGMPEKARLPARQSVEQLFSLPAQVY